MTFSTHRRGRRLRMGTRRPDGPRRRRRARFPRRGRVRRDHHDPAAVGGFGILTGGAPPVDTDRDGMPDTWERANGLNPTDPADGDDIGADGYSTVERYLNGLVPASS